MVFTVNWTSAKCIKGCQKGYQQHDGSAVSVPVSRDSVTVSQHVQYHLSFTPLLFLLCNQSSGEKGVSWLTLRACGKCATVYSFALSGHSVSCEITPRCLMRMSCDILLTVTMQTGSPVKEVTIPRKNDKHIAQAYVNIKISTNENWCV